MISPFPGVDPYIEAQGYWPDFRGSFITYLRDALNDVLPDHYDARIDERLSLVEQPAEKVKRIEPDVVITWRGSSWESWPLRLALGSSSPSPYPSSSRKRTVRSFIEI